MTSYNDPSLKIYEIFNKKDDQRVDLLIAVMFSFPLFYLGLSLPLMKIHNAWFLQLPYQYCLPELLLGLLYCIFAIFTLVGLQRTKRATILYFMGYYFGFLYGMIVLNAGIRLLAITNPVALPIFLIIFAGNLFAIRKQAYLHTEKIAYARKKKWLKKNLDEVNWTWHKSVQNKPRLLPEGEAQEQEKWVNRLLKLSPLFHVFTLMIIKNVSAIGITLVICSSYFLIIGFSEQLSYILQFREWEKETGKPLLLREVVEKADKKASQLREILPPL